MTIKRCLCLRGADCVLLVLLVWILLCVRSYRCSVFSAEGSSPVFLQRQQRDADPGCRRNITVTDSPGKVTSPGFPQNYKPNQDCRWRFTAQAGKIVFHFRTLSIEEMPDCRYDYVEIFVGENLTSLGKLCGNVANKSIATNSTTAVVIFKSDDSYGEAGFELEYSTDRAETSESCHGTFTEHEGNVTSPQYPFQYPDNSSCWMLINVEPGRVITMQFKVISMEFDEACAYDFVEIYDGPTEDSKSFGRFCGESQKRTLHSSGNTALIHFKSDDLLNNRGFHLVYTSAPSGLRVASTGTCSVTSNKENGTITSPNYPNKYPPETKCNLTLEAPLDYAVLLKFEDFFLEPDDQCSFDYVELWDYTPTGWESLMKVCGHRGNMKEVVSSQEKLMLVFLTDNISEFKGFKAYFDIVSRGVNNVTSTSVFGKPQAVNPEELFDELPKNHSLPFGGSNILRCTSKIPGARITWKKDDRLLNGSTPLPNLRLINRDTLWIERMEILLEGRYTCTIDTDSRESSVTALVKMEGRQEENTCEIYFKKSPKDQHLIHGETATMLCNALVPNRNTSGIVITWMKNRQRFPGSMRYHDLGTGLMYITDVTPKDSGVYTCVATDARNNCSKEESAVLMVVPRVNVEEVCGRPFAGKPNVEKPHMDHGKIVGGMDSVKGAYPWQVMFWTESRKAFCGGSLLNDQWILTAAHCFKRTDIQVQDVKVYLGKYDQKNTEPEEFQTRILDVYSHADFDDDTFDNDVALVQLAERVKFTDYIKPVCLGETSFIEREYFGNDLRLGTVTGWGQLSELGNTPRYLQEIRLPIVDPYTCKISTKYPVTRNMFCAGYKQDIIGDACKGDSGGPFVVEHNRRWYVLGVVSWGVGCGRAGQYGYYIKVNNYHAWIKEKISL